MGAICFSAKKKGKKANTENLPQDPPFCPPIPPYPPYIPSYPPYSPPIPPYPPYIPNLHPYNPPIVQIPQTLPKYTNNFPPPIVQVPLNPPKIEKIRELEYWISEKFLTLILYTEKQVMITLKEEFSKLFSKWFAMLVSDSLNAKLDDDFSPVIEHQDYELDYSFLSGGERTAIALAYRLSLNQVINSLLSNIKTRNLVILDEPTDGFSSTQLDKMKEVFEKPIKLEEDNRFFYISEIL